MLEQTAVLAAWKLLLLRASDARLMASIQPACAALRGPLLHSSSNSSAGRALSTWQQQGHQQGLSSPSPADSQSCAATAAGGSATLQPAPRQASSSNTCSSSSSTCSSKPAKSAAGDEPLQEQRLTWQQQQRQPWQQQQLVLPCSGSQGQDHSPPDQQCYQGRAGGVVTLPKQGTPLWEATFNGNVPTHWWQQDKGSCTDSTSSTTSSSNTSSSITSWEQLVQQSPVVISSFRRARARHSLHWHGVLVAVGRQAGLERKKSGRDAPACPRPVIARLARLRLLHQLTPVLEDVGGDRFVGRSVYVYNRLRQLRGQQNRQQQQQQGGAVQHFQPRHRRFDLRSRGYLAAAADALAANQRRSRARWHHPPTKIEAEAAAAAAAAEEDDDDGGKVSSGVGPADRIVPAMGRLKTLESPQSAAAAAGKVSRCVARRDEQGLLLPLPDRCIAAGSDCSSCSSIGVNDSVQQQQQRQEKHAGAFACLSRYRSDSYRSSSTGYVAESAGRKGRGIAPRPSNWHQQRAKLKDLAADAAAAAAAAAARPDTGPLPAVVEQLYTLTRESMEKVQQQNAAAAENAAQQLYAEVIAAKASRSHPDAAAVGSHPSWWPSVDGNDSIESECDSDVESSDDEDDGSYDSDNDSDDDVLQAGRVEYSRDDLPPEVWAELQHPHTFRNASGVVYGFWSKCPLG